MFNDLVLNIKAFFVKFLNNAIAFVNDTYKYVAKLAYVPLFYSFYIVYSFFVPNFSIIEYFDFIFLPISILILEIQIIVINICESLVEPIISLFLLINIISLEIQIIFISFYYYTKELLEYFYYFPYLRTMYTYRLNFEDLDKLKLLHTHDIINYAELFYVTNPVNNIDYCELMPTNINNNTAFALNTHFPSYKSYTIVTLTVWQYWWWMIFVFVITFFNRIILKLTFRDNSLAKPTVHGALKSNGRWGDLVASAFPIFWCANILLNSNFILRITENHSESALFTLRVRGKQWYWVYKTSVNLHKEVSERPIIIGRENIINFTQFMKNKHILHKEVFFDKMRPFLLNSEVCELKIKQSNKIKFNLYKYNNFSKILIDKFNISEKELKLIFNIHNYVSHVKYNKNVYKNNRNLIYLIKSYDKNQLFSAKLITENWLKKYNRHFNTLQQQPVSSWNLNRSVNFFSPEYTYNVNRRNINFLQVIDLFHKAKELKRYKINYPSVYYDDNNYKIEKLLNLSNRNKKNMLYNYKLNHIKNNLKHLKKLSKHNVNLNFKDDLDWLILSNIIRESKNLKINNNKTISTKKKLIITPVNEFLKNKITNKNRLLSTHNTLLLPIKENITVVTNSFDVVHSWFIPALAIKFDCVPGRSTHYTFRIDKPGIYFGHCAEVCGRFHHHMPIKIVAVPFNQFLYYYDLYY